MEFLKAAQSKKGFLEEQLEVSKEFLKECKNLIESYVCIYQNLMSLEEINKAYLENNETLNKHSIQNLIFHILYDEEPAPAIILASYCSAVELANNIASLCKHKDEYIREEVMACLLGYMRLSEYALLAVERYEVEESFGVKARILFNLGYVINDVKDSKLKRRIADIIVEGIDKKDEETGYEYRTEAYHSIVTSLNIPIEEQPNFVENIGKEDVNNKIVEEFKRKYLKDVKK